MSQDELHISEPLPDWVERIIDSALTKHLQTCPVPERVRKLEVRLATLVGYMIGSGVVGGFTGAVVGKSLGIL